MDIKRSDQEDRLKPESSKCSMHRRGSCPETASLKQFLDQELNEHEYNEKYNYFQWDTTDQAILTTFTATYKEYKETLTDIDLAIHSYWKI